MRELTKVTKHNVVAFNYEGLDPKMRQSVKNEAEQVNVLLKRTAANIIAVGRHLQTVRDQMTGNLFQRWIWAEFDFAPDAARRYMLIAKRFADLPAKTAQLFQPTALLLLANKKIPPKAMLEAMHRAEQGEPITAGKAAEIIHRNRPPEDRRINRNDQKRLSQYVGDLARRKDDSELPEVADELQRQADRLRAKAGSNGHVGGSGAGGQGSGIEDLEPETCNLKPTTNGQPADRHVYLVRVSLGRALDQRETRLLRPLIENLLSEEFNDPGCQVEEIQAEAEAVT